MLSPCRVWLVSSVTIPSSGSFIPALLCRALPFFFGTAVSPNVRTKRAQLKSGCQAAGGMATQTGRRVHEGRIRQCCVGEKPKKLFGRGKVTGTRLMPYVSKHNTSVNPQGNKKNLYGTVP